MLLHTHLECVWTGPYPATDVYSLKYWGTERPMKTENPRMNLVLKLLRLQNWRKPSPAEPVGRLPTQLITITHICDAPIIIIENKTTNIRLEISTHQHKQRRYSTELQRWVQVLMRTQLQICLDSQNDPLGQHKYLCSQVARAFKIKMQMLG